MLKQLTEAAGDSLIVTCDVGQHQMWVAQHCRFTRPTGASDQRRPRHDGLWHSGRHRRPARRARSDRGHRHRRRLDHDEHPRAGDAPPLPAAAQDPAARQQRSWAWSGSGRNCSSTAISREIDLYDNPDFAEVARAFGIEAFTIDHRAEVPGAIERLLAYARPDPVPCPDRPARECLAAGAAQQPQRSNDGEESMSAAPSTNGSSSSSTPVEGAVLRMIGLVERRGFRIRRVAMAEQPCGRRGSLAAAGRAAPIPAARSTCSRASSAASTASGASATNPRTRAGGLT